MTTIPKPPVLKVSLIQLLFLLSVSAGFFWFDIVVGYSILLGGLTQWVPQFWFTYQAFKHAGASQAQKVLSSMYRGEAGKIVLTASGCIGTFVLFEDVTIIGFMGAFIAMIPLQLALVVRALK
jgi:ATP synthase protein I